MKKKNLWKSSHDLPKSDRQELVALLNQQLAEALDLGLQVKQAHWNVKGPAFITLHELFDEIADEISEFVDEIAERAVALGGIALGTVQTIASTSTLKAYPLEILSGEDHLDALVAAFSRYARSVRSAIDAAGKIGDAGTEDLFTGVSRKADDLLWKIEAHLATKS